MSSNAGREEEVRAPATGLRAERLDLCRFKMRTIEQSRTKSGVGKRAQRARRRSRRPRAVQGELFARTWGGARRGAGRKRQGPRRLVEHRPRESFSAGCPVHVTLRLADGLPSLRNRATYGALLAALGAGSERFGMRLVHWSVLGNHMHLMIEAADCRALSRGMQGLGVRVARALNRWWGRTGRVFADRYHAHVLGSPTEVRNALYYLLQNARHHRIVVDGADPYSSGQWFDGWLGGESGDEAALERPSWVRTARTWLLARGWRRLGLLDVDAWPGAP
jgi:REP element-mobilizing transposase RayT